MKWWETELTDADTKSQGRRAIANAYMQDAQRETTHWRSRSDFAFEVVYIYAISALGEQAEGYEHPDARVLPAAAKKLGLTSEQIRPAVLYLEHRYDAAIPDNSRACHLLISIAKMLGAER